MTEYVEDSGLTEAFKQLINNQEYTEFGPLRDSNARIMPIMKVKTNKDGEHQSSKGLPAVMKKVPDIMRAAGVNADFLLVVDYYAWNHPKGINPQMTQEAYLHHALMSVDVQEIVDDSGHKKLKTGSRDPDVSEFIATAKHYGGYDEDQVTLSTLVLQGVEAIEAKELKGLTNGDVNDAPPSVKTAEDVVAENKKPASTPSRRGRTPQHELQ